MGTAGLILAISLATGIKAVCGRRENLGTLWADTRGLTHVTARRRVYAAISSCNVSTDATVLRLSRRAALAQALSKFVANQEGRNWRGRRSVLKEHPFLRQHWHICRHVTRVTNRFRPAST